MGMEGTLWSLSMMPAILVENACVKSCCRRQNARECVRFADH